jgi:hypothetical protein
MLSLQNISAEVQLKMDRAPVDQTSNFQSDVSENLIFAYNGMAELANVPQKSGNRFLIGRIPRPRI